MATASRSLATALWGARFATGLLQPSYTTKRETTPDRSTPLIPHSFHDKTGCCFSPGQPTRMLAN